MVKFALLLVGALAFQHTVVPTPRTDALSVSRRDLIECVVF